MAATMASKLQMKPGKAAAFVPEGVTLDVPLAASGDEADAVLARARI